MTALHMAAYCGQTGTMKKQILNVILNTTFHSLLLLILDTVRELLSHIPATVRSDPPSGVSVLGVLGNESGMTPLHFAAYSGNENVVRLLLNSAGVQVDASTLESVHFYFYYLNKIIKQIIYFKRYFEGVQRTAFGMFRRSCHCSWTSFIKSSRFVT